MLSVRGPIREERPVRPAVRAAVPLVVAGELRPQPAPFLTEDHERVRIGVLHLSRVRQVLVAHLVHGGARRVHVAMGRVPERRLVVEDVVAHAAVDGEAPPRDEMGDPAPLNQVAVRDVGVGRRVPGDVGAVAGAHPVAGVGVPLRVIAGLRAVLGDGVAGELAPVRAERRDVVDDRDRDHRLCMAGTGRGHEVVAALPSGAARIADALEVPVLPAIVRVQLPVVARRVVAAVPVDRHVQVGELRGRRIGHAVDVGVDGVLRGGSINGHRHGAVLCRDDGDGDDNGGGRQQREEQSPHGANSLAYGELGKRVPVCASRATRSCRTTSSCSELATPVDIGIRRGAIRSPRSVQRRLSFRRCVQSMRWSLAPPRFFGHTPSQIWRRAAPRPMCPARRSGELS